MYGGVGGLAVHHDDEGKNHRDFNDKGEKRSKGKKAPVTRG